MIFKQSISYRLVFIIWFCPDRDHHKGKSISTLSWKDICFFFPSTIIFFTTEEARLSVQLTWPIYCNKLMRVWFPSQIVMACTPFYALVSISFFIFQLYFADSSCKNQGEQFQATQKSRSGYVSYNVFQQKSNVFVANQCSDLKTWKKGWSERYRQLWYSFIL